MFALQMLEAICTEETPAPAIVPGSSGELQIEWHTEQGDVELLVRAPNNVRAWRWSPNAGDDGDEVELRNDFYQAAMWIREVTEPEIAVQAAA
jgi:hypothetical protein